MFQKHTDQTGKTQLIATMEDSHLENTIKFILNKIESCKCIINSEIKTNDKFLSALVGVDEDYLFEKATDSVQDLTEGLYPYICEASLRGIDTTGLLQVTFDRTQQLGKKDFSYLLEDF